MSKRPLTPEIYAVALAAFRSQPAGYSYAAQQAGIDERTAKRLWQGPPSKMWPWAKTISLVLKEEEDKQRLLEQAAEIKAQEEQAAEAKRLTDVEKEASKIDENIKRTARATVLQGIAGLSRVSRGVDALANRLGEQLSRGTDSAGNKLDISPREGLRIIKDFSAATKGLLSAYAELKTIDRLHNGQPTAILGVAVKDVTMEDVEREFTLGQVALEEARRRSPLLSPSAKTGPFTVTPPGGTDDATDIEWEESPDDDEPELGDEDDENIPGAPRAS